jgi:hypothetical protein
MARLLSLLLDCLWMALVMLAAAGVTLLYGL